MAGNIHTNKNCAIKKGVKMYWWYLSMYIYFHLTLKNKIDFIIYFYPTYCTCTLY